MNDIEMDEDKDPKLELCCEYCYSQHLLLWLLIIDTPFEYAHCPKCGAKHAWDDEDGRWFGL